MGSASAAAQKAEMEADLRGVHEVVEAATKDNPDKLRARKGQQLESLNKPLQIGPWTSSR